MKPLALTHYTLVNALGLGLAASHEGLRQRKGGLRPCDFQDAALDTYIGRVAAVEDQPVCNALIEFDGRNNRLAQLGLRQDGFQEAVEAARARYGGRRIAVVIGTSTSGILETERAYRARGPETSVLPCSFHYRYSQDIFSVADFVKRYLHLEGPALAVSTACSSSAKVFATAARLIQAGLCDASVVGGVDSLCLTTLYGFSSLELTSPRPCRPCDAERDGISIGEAAGFALLEKKAEAAEGIALLGYGESTDAYHMSSPHPEGLGAILAMQRALQSAGLNPQEIDYINLHGTASKPNDSAEDKAISRVFGSRTSCSSTKGWIGHTLGAAGIGEAIFACLCIRYGFMPGNLNTETIDPFFTSHMLLENREQRITKVLSNSFGFGGNNCSLILGAMS